MELQRFLELCNAFGAQRRRWPDTAQPLFDHYAQTPEGKQALADAARVDALLDSWPDTADDTEREARVLAAITAQTQRGARAVWVSTAFAACLLLGFALGFMQPTSTATETPESYASAVFGDSMLEELP